LSHPPAGLLAARYAANIDGSEFAGLDPPQDGVLTDDVTGAEVLNGIETSHGALFHEERFAAYGIRRSAGARILKIVTLPYRLGLANQRIVRTVEPSRAGLLVTLSPTNRSRLT